MSLGDIFLSKAMTKISNLGSAIGYCFPNDTYDLSFNLNPYRVFGVDFFLFDLSKFGHQELTNYLLECKNEGWGFFEHQLFLAGKLLGVKIIELSNGKNSFKKIENDHIAFGQNINETQFIQWNHNKDKLESFFTKKKINLPNKYHTSIIFIQGLGFRQFIKFFKKYSTYRFLLLRDFLKKGTLMTSSLIKK